MIKRLVINYIILIFILSSVFWFTWTIFLPQSQLESAKFTIHQGESALSVAMNLKKEGILKSPFVFLIYSFLSGGYSRFQPGTYLLKKPFTIENILKTITANPTEVLVTIIPGMTLKEIDLVLWERGAIEKGSLAGMNFSDLKANYPFLQKADSLEGFLFPDSYKFYLSMDSADVVKIMLDNFYQKAWPKLSLSKNPYQTLIIASLLEKEVLNYDDKRIVAGIINKRLKLEMPLQLDATVVYASCKGKFINCSPLSKSDFSVDSPYNTYKIKGLPPTPIGNPSLESIRAALEPISSKYIYYLSNPKDKKTIFSKDFYDHNINRQKYLGL